MGPFLLTFERKSRQNSSRILRASTLIQAVLLFESDQRLAALAAVRWAEDYTIMTKQIVYTRFQSNENCFISGKYVRLSLQEAVSLLEPSSLIVSCKMTSSLSVRGWTTTTTLIVAQEKLSYGNCCVVLHRSPRPQDYSAYDAISFSHRGLQEAWWPLPLPCLVSYVPAPSLSS